MKRKINYCRTTPDDVAEFTSADFGGTVKIGDDPWSQDFIAGIKHSLCYSLASAWADGQDPKWRDTYYFQYFAEKLCVHGEIWDGILRNEEDIIQQMHRFRNLFESMVAHPDYRDDKIIWHHKNGADYYYGNYPVAITEGGNLQSHDGNHRLAILLALGRAISVTICVRTPGWQRLHDSVESLYPSGYLYQPIPHLDFSRFESRSADKERLLLEVIKGLGIKSIYDLGCCHGFTLYKLKPSIDWAIGVESDAARYQISKLILDKIGFTHSNENMLEFMVNIENTVGAVMSLSSLHHVMRLEKQECFDALLHTISEKTHCFIYELPGPSEPQYSWMYPEIRDDIDDYIQKKTGLMHRQTFAGTRQIHVLRRF